MSDIDKEYTVVIQTPATKMLIEHARFLAQVSETAAKRLADEFYNKAKTLESIPERCAWLTGYSIPEKKFRKMIFEKNYMLVFQIIGNIVYIDAIVDCRSEYHWLLDNT
jgi:hypothetical protein